MPAPACRSTRCVDSFPAPRSRASIDGKVLTESIGTALAAGRFARVPILNGINHDEELHLHRRPRPGRERRDVRAASRAPVTADATRATSPPSSACPAPRAAAIAAEYPLGAYHAPDVAFSTLVSDANFACPALQVDRWTSARVPTFAYQFNDDTAPAALRTAPALPAVATHSSELQYLFDLPNTPVPATLDADQQPLADAMRAAWASFAADRRPVNGGACPGRRSPPGRRSCRSSRRSHRSRPASRATHHCSFWFAG